MYRRALLVASVSLLGFSSLSGCLGLQPSDSDDDPESEPTPTETPVPFPETCGPLPDIDELPDPPSELTEETVETFVRDFERVYAVATNDEYGGVNTLDIDSVETVDDRYIVRVSFEATAVTQTPDADGETPTPLPIDGYTHRAVYRLTNDRMLRELRSHIDDSLFSRICWILSG